MRRCHVSLLHLVLVLLFFCPYVSLWALNTASLYQITVPVASMLPDQRDLAESEGFRQVLIKLTSDPEIAKNPVIATNLNRAEYYVSDYNYSPPSPDSSEYIMQIRYEKEDVVRLLKKASVPFWGESRPLTLAWVVLTDMNNQTDVLGNDASQKVYKLIKEQSRRLGIALIFPMMDVDDISRIDTQKIMDVALPELTLASKRYSPDVLLIAQIDQVADLVTGKWILMINANRQEWNVSGKTTEEMVNAALLKISQTMLRQYQGVRG